MKVFVSSHCHIYTKGHILNQIVVAKILMGHRRFEPRTSDLETGTLPPLQPSSLNFFAIYNLITNVALGISMTMRANNNLYSRHILRPENRCNPV